MSFEQPVLKDSDLSRELEKGFKFATGFRVYGIAQCEGDRFGVVFADITQDGKVKGNWQVAGHLEEIREYAADRFMKELKYREKVLY